MSLSASSSLMTPSSWSVRAASSTPDASFLMSNAWPRPPSRASLLTVV